MKSLWMRGLASLALGTLLVVVGCGESSEKVDLKTQLGKLGGDADTKIAAMAEISKLGEAAASAVPQLTPLLKDEDSVVRRTAAYTLGTIGPAAKSALPELKEMLKTDDRDQMTAVANAIRAIDATAVPGLKVENVSN